MSSAVSIVDRETFLAAIARHRRASWRVTAACALAVIVIAVVVAILMAPLLYCLLALGFDLINLATPTPDLMRWMGRLLDPIFSARTSASLATIVRAGAIAALPGLALMAIAALGLRRIWKRSPLFDGGDLPGRPPDRSVLAEERLANVVEEMAIAAGIPAPRVVIVPGGVNAAACGRDQSHVTILVGDALPTSLDREQLEGAIGHLIGSIANGDMTIGLRVTTTLALFSLVARASSSLDDRFAFHQTAGLWRVFVAPTSANTIALLGALADPFCDAAARPATAPPVSRGSALTWREWLMMPLMGPVLITGFLSAMVTGFLLQPLIALAWRQRKYMADATAVQLTRDPDALAGALAAMADSPKGIVPWTAHLAVAADPHSEAGSLGGGMVPVFPSVEKRTRALARLGAHVTLTKSSRMPWPLLMIAGVLGAVLAALMGVVVYLLVIVSAALSGLFTVVPAALLHVLLRSFGR
jgi:Zn-dependent protease with chaperone function